MGTRLLAKLIENPNGQKTQPTIKPYAQLGLDQLIGEISAQPSKRTHGLSTASRPSVRHHHQLSSITVVVLQQPAKPLTALHITNLQSTLVILFHETVV